MCVTVAADNVGLDGFEHSGVTRSYLWLTRDGMFAPSSLLTGKNERKRYWKKKGRAREKKGQLVLLAVDESLNLASFAHCHKMLTSNFPTRPPYSP